LRSSPMPYSPCNLRKHRTRPRAEKRDASAPALHALVLAHVFLVRVLVRVEVSAK
jgi:hypothetical protein